MLVCKLGQPVARPDYRHPMPTYRSCSSQPSFDLSPRRIDLHQGAGPWLFGLGERHEVVGTKDRGRDRRARSPYGG
jgi:hypothetical protein